MKHQFMSAVLVLLALFICAQTIQAQSNVVSIGPTLVVDDDKVQCPTAGYTTIQSAIDAASPGSNIRVCAGTYPEQLIINKTLQIYGDNGALVEPVGVTANVSTTSEPTAAVIFVQNAQNVQISGLIIDGIKNGLTECAPFLVGVFYQNSSGTLHHNAIRNMYLSPDLNGCQSGDGVDVDSTGTPVKVTVSGNSINGYQKNGVTGDDVGTTVSIQQNVVSGAGRTNGAAQNGIQIGFGAVGEIIGNSVANNYYLPCTSADTCSTGATGILIFESDGVTIESNTLESNQLNIYVQGNHANIQQNLIANSPVLDGISLFGDNNQVSLNKVVRSDQAGILLSGNNNQIFDNEIGDAPVGILKLAGFTGNTLLGNHIFATLVAVQDPVPAHSFAVQPRH
jgi:nitrous oxidase accessory protein NosD